WDRFSSRQPCVDEKNNVDVNRNVRSTRAQVRTRQGGSRSTDYPQTERRPVQALFAKARSENEEAPQPRNVQESSGCREARTRRTVLQARRLSRQLQLHLRMPRPGDGNL